MRTLDSAAEEAADGRFEDYFREGAAPLDALRLWQLAQQAPLIDALRALFHGPSELVRLRVWVFVELMALPQSRIERDELNRHFHQLRAEPLDLVLKRLRDAGLLQWETTTQVYSVPPLAQQVMTLLAPLVRSPDDDADLAGMLASVAGAHQLGILEPAQLQHLQAQLARLHDEFADAITSGSEFRLRQARRRFDRALTLVDRASEALTAIITGAKGQARLERLARELGLAQARLLAMASQFNRALQQADRQRVTLGTTGITTTDVKRWLQGLAGNAALAALAAGAGLQRVAPVFVAQHDLLDVAESEFERDRTSAAAEPLPAPRPAPVGRMEGLALPDELYAMVARLAAWSEAVPEPHDLAEALLGGRFAQAAYRGQLLPLIGDAQAQELQGATGELARSPWRVTWGADLRESADAQVRALSAGVIEPARGGAAAEVARDERAAGAGAAPSEPGSPAAAAAGPATTAAPPLEPAPADAAT